MTTATKEKQRIDKFLRSWGSGIGQLVRIVGTTNQVSYSVDVKAHVRDYLPNELTSTIIQGDSKVIISAREIVETGWPGSQPTPPVPGNDVRVPRRGDKFVWMGKQRNVEVPDPFYFDGELIKIEMQVRGTQ